MYGLTVLMTIPAETTVGRADRGETTGLKEVTEDEGFYFKDVPTPVELVRIVDMNPAQRKNTPELRSIHSTLILQSLSFELQELLLERGLESDINPEHPIDSLVRYATTHLRDGDEGLRMAETIKKSLDELLVYLRADIAIHDIALTENVFNLRLARRWDTEKREKFVQCGSILLGSFVQRYDPRTDGLNMYDHINRYIPKNTKLIAIGKTPQLFAPDHYAQDAPVETVLRIEGDVTVRQMEPEQKDPAAAVRDRYGSLSPDGLARFKRWTLDKSINGMVVTILENGGDAGIYAGRTKQDLANILRLLDKTLDEFTVYRSRQIAQQPAEVEKVTTISPEDRQSAEIPPVSQVPRYRLFVKSNLGTIEVAGMTHDQKRCFTRYYIEGMTQKDMAAEDDLYRSDVHALVREARALYEYYVVYGKPWVRRIEE